MKKIALTLACFLSMTTAACAENEEWQRCTTDNECTIVGAGCAIRAVNHDSAANADVFYKKMNSTMDCNVPENPLPQIAACRSNKCVVIRSAMPE